jgi:GH15 family glucan-1,4-alpha-glucosidase
MPDNYVPISHYAVIGNMHTAALISKEGSIDWCCLPYFDSASVFAAILDNQRGGLFKVSLKDGKEGTQEYVIDSNVLRTTFEENKIKLMVTDFMPLSGNLEEFESMEIEPEIQRIIECKGDDCEVEVIWAPRLDYARKDTVITYIDNGWTSGDTAGKLTLCGIQRSEVIEENKNSIKAIIKLKKGEKRVLITRWGSRNTSYDIEESLQGMNKTIQAWQEWSHVMNGDNHNWAGDWLPFILRSELVLKLLDYAKTGAILAAPTTSLPEVIGGVRNWDYRFVWIRDAALSMKALMALGHYKEADHFMHWVEEMAADEFKNYLSLQIMYTIEGDAEINEEELHHLEGYRKSSPVRIGNGAAKQFQLETFGEVMIIGYELLKLGSTLSSKEMSMMKDLADFVSRVWKEKDSGIWEIRGERQHYIYSKIMAWVVLDKAVYLHNNYGLDGEVNKWLEERNNIKDYVLKHGYNKEVDSFIQYPGIKDTDASLLRIPLVEFLPPEDYRVQNTINYIMECLMENKMVYRYKNDDGLPGKEGAFNLCTFWLVDALALCGRVDEAKDIFANMIRHANHAGLFSEQINPSTGEHLGNFPQAFTHIGLINSAMYIAYAEGKKLPVEHLTGTKEHRKLMGRDY